MSNKYNLVASEAILKQALLECDEEYMLSLPSKEDLKKLYTPSEYLDRKIRGQIRKAERVDFLRSSVTIAKRVAVVGTAITALAFGALMTNQEVRAVVRNTIVEWFSGFTRFTFTNDAGETQMGEWTIGYIPQGYDLVEIQELHTVHIASFQNAAMPEGVNYIRLVYAPIGDLAIGVDNENASYDIEYHQGIEFHIMKSELEDFPSVVIWARVGVSFQLSGYCPWTELVKMAQSIKK